ncbi:PIG-L family deacetylase [Candidatus Daviesbacteria bacterium]|nr:PIG-L family deacetylase [Candidatus Daviesbacteria bacterium]
MDFEVQGKTILFVCAHPDDLEFCFGGTVAKWAGEGASIYYLILTDGSKGCEDPQLDPTELIKTRQREQDEAAKILGVKKVIFLDHVDGELENNPKLRKQIVRVIRKIKPDIVVTMDPTFVYDEKYGIINHPDHRVAGQTTLDSVYPFARNHRAFPELLDEGLTPHHVSDILLFNSLRMNFFVDIEDTLAKKLKALNCHKSQFKDPQAVEKLVILVAQNAGKKAKLKYAEGLTWVHINF